MAENKSLFLWNGRSYSAAEFVDLQGVPEYVVAVQSALKFCISQATEWTLETSGSTGSPKAIALTRAMIYGSARATLDRFELVPGSTAALVLPAKYIGGFMMASVRVGSQVSVRAAVGWDWIGLGWVGLEQWWGWWYRDVMGWNSGGLCCVVRCGVVWCGVVRCGVVSVVLGVHG